MLVNGVVEFFYILADNLIVLLVSEWGLLIPSVMVAMSVSSFSCISFCFLYFEIMSSPILALNVSSFAK